MRSGIIGTPLRPIPKNPVPPSSKKRLNSPKQQHRQIKLISDKDAEKNKTKNVVGRADSFLQNLKSMQEMLKLRQAVKTDLQESFCSLSATGCKEVEDSKTCELEIQSNEDVQVVGNTNSFATSISIAISISKSNASDAMEHEDVGNLSESKCNSSNDSETKTKTPAYKIKPKLKGGNMWYLPGSKTSRTEQHNFHMKLPKHPSSVPLKRKILTSPKKRMPRIILASPMKLHFITR